MDGDSEVGGVSDKRQKTEQPLRGGERLSRMESLAQDVKLAFRGLAKAPAFTAVAVVSLALGIGANTAIFTLLDQVLLRRLPVKSPEELALMTMVGSHYGSNWGGNALSYPMYVDLRDNNRVFTGMFCRFRTRVSSSFDGETERVAAELVSGTYFPVLGVGAALGRTLTPDDDREPGGHPLAMLSYDYWRSRFGGDPSVLGRTLVVNGHNLTIVGVAQDGFTGVELEFRPQIFVPMMMKAQMTPFWDALKDRRMRFVNAFGRLKPGVSREQAKASLQPFFKGILEMEVKEPAFRNASVEAREAFLKNVLDVIPGGQGRSYLRRQLQAPFSVLLGLTAGVLLIACANVAGLLLARAAAREKEIAVRLAVGASRMRLVRLLLAESLVLAGVGALVGLAVAWGTNRAVLALLPPDFARMNLRASPDLRTLLFTAGLAAATAVVFGLLPALQSTRPHLAPTLKEQAGAVAGGLKQARFRQALVAVQVALSLLLLIGAGLFARTLFNLRKLGPGFPTESLLAFSLDPSLNGYEAGRAKGFYRQLTRELQAVPGVSEVGLAAVGILQDNEWDSSVTVEGHVAAPGEDVNPYMNSISPGYFAALGASIVAGRDFTDADTEEQLHQEAVGAEEPFYTPRVVIVNEKFARRFFPNESALGRRVGFGSDPGTPTDMEIVGVVKDIKYTNLRDEIPIQMFIPYLASRYVGDMTVYVRAGLSPEQVVTSARERVRALDPQLPLYDVRTIEHRVSDSLLVERLVAGLSAAFGALATVLACVGLYGVLAYNVTRRSREIGVRMALGARAADVVRLVLREAVVLLLIGLAAGLPVALALARAVQSQLFGVHFADVSTILAASVSLTLVAGLAGYLPARRASRFDPVRTLRYE
jgi:predicted permease